MAVADIIKSEEYSPGVIAAPLYRHQRSLKNST